MREASSVKGISREVENREQRRQASQYARPIERPMRHRQANPIATRVKSRHG